jgi:hypothetical protein
MLVEFLLHPSLIALPVNMPLQFGLSPLQLAFSASRASIFDIHLMLSAINICLMGAAVGAAVGVAAEGGCETPRSIARSVAL